MKPLINEVEAYLMAAVAVILDHVITWMVMKNPYVREANPNTSYLMSIGMWGVFDAAVLVASIAASAYILRKWSFENRWVILLYFVAGAVIRMAAVLSNLMIWMLL